MVQATHMILLCLSMIRAETQLGETPDDIILDQGHEERKLLFTPAEGADSFRASASSRSSPYLRESERSVTGPDFDFVKKRRLLRSDLGKRSYDVPRQQAGGNDFTSETAPGTEMLSDASDQENVFGHNKRSNNHAWKLWQLKEGWKKRPMLREDLGKRQMIRSDLG